MLRRRSQQELEPKIAVELVTNLEPRVSKRGLLESR
jgi:hypothetical protein